MRRLLPVLFLAALCSCSTEAVRGYPDIFPDYIAVTVPEGMAPLKFRMSDGSRCRVKVRREADTLWYSVRSGSFSYEPFPVYLSKDPIDPYVAYRLVEPGYESWNHISIVERELGCYRERTIVSNNSTGGGCVNCHSFRPADNGAMMFHARGTGGGTVFSIESELYRKDLSKTGICRQGAYPAWHPAGRYIVYSSNKTKQHFLVGSFQPIEVYDNASDIIMYDTVSGETSMVISTQDSLETFPAWSEDGGTLYYCSARDVGNIGTNRGQVRYSLMALDFDGEKFVGSPRRIWGSDSLSVSFPRPNGGYILFTGSDFGTFPIWHKEADLYMLNLEDGSVRSADALNSDDTESYHSWSSNGRWLVFSSRRLDGRYTRLYLAHYDGNGHFDKPFLLPQRNPDHNTLRLQSYNVPEFVCRDYSTMDRRVRKLFGQ